ncbi:bifunctional 3-(3-hydroxy-phenyl)propionate/3-hydroxycinnamic acid hydroxylase [Duganella sp. FT80W]|uniref:Bifunctional 3-(3-hydroxy-phenyl)propionate/3-hydroxycinnamic acid hydroxylase n=1 Tax=Duganella guangzhouensis TaxID=2666084 RepID=A0A6I2KYX4_9BURK|nr:bifunctional 3-(3-hydroxy-phenyl)propionate/3-hydroxycinnamic acid hydroxylase [Duganella guangzhouensis]MRW89219.1 bifunctional 3-(3-hydroxy-phenyl)propionate/3-hydroxycinnamic acid hydroxylase [Duganella guangzhouensis]
MNALHDQYDVVIVGFGPSGAVAAALLGQAGVRTLVVDRSRTVYERPRAIALDHEIMRVFQQLGLDQEISRYCEPFTPSEYYGADGKLIKRLATVEPPYPLGHSPSMVFTQPEVERVLRNHVAELPSVTVALGQRMTALQQDDDRATLALIDDEGNGRTVHASYVIGCDGASSTVRDAAGISLEDLEFDEPWLVVDVLINERGLAKLPKTSVQYCEPERPCTYVIGPGMHRRWEISLLPGEDPQYMASEEGAWSVLQRWVTPDDAKLWRQASYRFHALVAREWRNGRVFIAGDAAHQQPPFLGQGMCQGVRDVANLVWKLRAALKGNRNAEALLDSYGVERGDHVRALTSRIKEIGKVICERDPQRARERDAALIAAAGGEIRTQARQDIIPPLQHGLLAGGGDGLQKAPQSGVGTLFPQPRLRREGSPLMDAVAGCGWRVVTAAELPQALAQRAAVAATVVRVAPDDECDGVLTKWFARHQCSVAIVRPDNYVYGVAANSDALAALLDEWEASIAIA